MPALHPLLTIHTESQLDAYIICVEGELDQTGCVDLEAALEAARRARADRIVLDIERLVFIDSSGLGTLLRASREAASNGNHLELTRGQGYPAEMFRLTALDQTLPLTDPALCPAIQGAGATPQETWGGLSCGAPSRPVLVPDDSNRPRMGEQSLTGPER